MTPALDPRAIVVVFTVRAPLWIVLDEKVAVPLTLSAPETFTFDENVEIPPWIDVPLTLNAPETFTFDENVEIPPWIDVPLTLNAPDTFTLDRKVAIPVLDWVPATVILEENVEFPEIVTPPADEGFSRILDVADSTRLLDVALILPIETYVIVPTPGAPVAGGDAIAE